MMPGTRTEGRRAGGGSFFGRRKGKTLKPSQREALEHALPIDLSVPPPERLSDLFPVPVEAIRLEIGFGGGEHLIHQARSLPRIGFIGVEPFQNGFAKVASVIRRDGIANVRLFGEDATLLLDWLPPVSLERIDLLYPDPWPKMRHWKRRFVNAANLQRIARCLAPGGTFRFASDVEAYVIWTLREAARHGALAWFEGSREASNRPWSDWPGTRYEAKARIAGRGTTYLTFRKPG